MIRQLPLGLALPSRPARGRSSFIISGSNADAVALIDGWRRWPGGVLVLSGPEGAGKTHLACVWADMTGAERISAASLTSEDAPALISGGAAAIEDADRVSGDRASEAALFHLFNLARAERASLLITGRRAASQWGIVTKDLASRLTGALGAALEPPDEELLTGLIAKHFQDRRLAVGDDVIRFLSRRIERSALAAAEVTARLDEAALMEKRSITLPFVKDVTGL